MSAQAPGSAGRTPAARTIGKAMRDQGVVYDHVIASPAVRVVETIEGVEQGFGSTLAPHYDRRIYLASTAALLDLVHDADAGCDSLLMIGHNPGLESLALLLSRPSAARDEIAVKYPTATLVEIGFEVAQWGEIDKGGGTIARFIRPRDLDPDLGPDPNGY